MTAILLASLAILRTLSGELPLHVDPDAVVRIVWESADASGAIQRSDCQLKRPRGWTCGSQSSGDIGVVVISLAHEFAFVVIGRQGVIAEGTALWTRMIRAVVSSEPGGEIAEVTATTLKVSHPVARPNTRVLDVDPDAAVHVWPIA